jgi:hypothetical protein
VTVDIAEKTARLASLSDTTIFVRHNDLRQAAGASSYSRSAAHRRKRPAPLRAAFSRAWRQQNREDRLADEADRIVGHD